MPVAPPPSPQRSEEVLEDERVDACRDFEESEVLDDSEAKHGDPANADENEIEVPSGGFLHIGTEELASKSDDEIAKRAEAFRSNRHGSAESSRSARSTRSSLSSSFGSRRGSRAERIRSLSVKSRRALVDQLLVYVVIPNDVQRLTTITAPLNVFARRCEVHTVAAHQTIGGIFKEHKMDVNMQPEFTFSNAPLDADMVVVLGNMRASVRKWLKKFSDEPVVIRIKGARLTRYTDKMKTKTTQHLNSNTDVDASLDLLDALYNEAAGKSSGHDPFSPTSQTSESFSPTITSPVSPVDSNASVAIPPFPAISGNTHSNKNLNSLKPSSSSASLRTLTPSSSANNLANFESGRPHTASELSSASSASSSSPHEDETTPSIASTNISSIPGSTRIRLDKDIAESPEYDIFSDTISEVSSQDGPPGDQVAEELGFYRHFFGTPERFQLATRDKLALFSHKMKALVRERIIGVILYDGVDELGVSAILDTWGWVSGVRILLLSVSKCEKVELDNLPILEAPVIESANGLRFTDVRPLSSFARSPAAVSSLDFCIVPPAGRSTRVVPTVSFIRKRFSKISGPEALRCEFWDQTSLTPIEVYKHQMKKIADTYSEAAAKAVSRKLVLGKKK